MRSYVAVLPVLAAVVGAQIDPSSVTLALRSKQSRFHLIILHLTLFQHHGALPRPPNAHFSAPKSLQTIRLQRRRTAATPRL